MDKPDYQLLITEAFDSLRDVVLEKNRRYGDSAFKPIGVFAKSNAEEGIRIRLDDKLKRIVNSSELNLNDMADIAGYIMLWIVEKRFTNNDFKNLLD